MSKPSDSQLGRGVELPMVPARHERGDAARNRARILDAARRLFAERDPGRVSMDDIAAAAGVGKGTVFRRFGDRAALAHALLDEDMRDFQDAFLRGAPPLGPGAPPAERLEAFLLTLLALQLTKLPFAVAAFPGDASPGISMQPLLVHTSALIAEARSDVEPTVTAMLLLSAVAPAAILAARALGATDQQLRESALAVLTGIVAPESRPGAG